MQAFLRSLINSAGKSGMNFAFTKSKVTLKDWTGSKLNLVCARLGDAERFGYLGSYISPGDRISRIQKA